MSKFSLPTSTTASLSLVKRSSVKTSSADETSEPLSDPSLDSINVDNCRDVADTSAAYHMDAMAQTDPLSSRALWLAVYFPQLALEMPLGSQLGVRGSSNSEVMGSSASDSSNVTCCAVAVEKVKGRSLIHSVSDAAAAHGISIGMALNAAYSLYSALQVRCYDEKQQRNYMQQLARWAMQFSSQVSIADSATLLLEIKGSLRYYGGLQTLLRRFARQLAAYRSHKIRLAVAPTAAAGLLLAKTQGGDIVLQDYRRLRSVLSGVRINDLPVSPKLKQKLRRLGLRSLQDLWRLPRQDLSRRYGEALVVYLDALTGMNTEMLDYYRLPDHFTCQWHLDYETRDAAALTRIVKQLLEKLEEYLIQCDYHIHGYSVELLSAKKKPYVITIGLRKPGRELSHLLTLFEEQLKGRVIADKIASVKLQSRHLVKAAVASASLAFSHEVVQSEAGIDIDELLDLIQARLGKVAIKSLHSRPDHRPEYAGLFAHQAPSVAVASSPMSAKTSSQTDDSYWKQRPLWLLPDPYPLRTRQRQPVYGDVLKLLEGPERIEAAWWSDADVRRDYYCAVTPNGQRLWIYQELNAPYKWYLHGFFA